MSVDAANANIRRGISDILSKFLATSEFREDSYIALLSELYPRFQFGSVDAERLNAMLVGRPDVEMRDQNQFLHLKRVERGGIWPFVTFQSSDCWRHFRIYALLVSLDYRSELQLFALRFETDEGDHCSGAGTHDFCHAQLCADINKRVTKVVDSWIPDSQPSFPLDAGNQMELVLCMLVSLYGSTYVRSKVDRRDYVRYLNGVRALRVPGTKCHRSVD